MLQIPYTSSKEIVVDTATRERIRYVFRSKVRAVGFSAEDPLGVMTPPVKHTINDSQERLRESKVIPPDQEEGFDHKYKTFIGRQNGRES